MIIDDAKKFLTKAIGVEVDTSQHILLKLEEAISKFNEDSSGQEKLIEKVEKKFDNKVLEHIAQQIAIQQLDLSSILTSLETSCTNVTSLFAKLFDIIEYTKEIKSKLNKIDEDLMASAKQLQLDSNSSSTHHMKIRFLLDMQVDFFSEETRIQSTLLEIQNMILPIMDSMQNHIAYSKTLIHNNNFLIVDHMQKCKLLYKRAKFCKTTGTRPQH